jgi:predicted nucleotidyltransferase
MPAAKIETIAELSRREWMRITSSRDGASSVAEGPDKLGALRDAVTALANADIPCALIGGVAVGVRSGVPRATLDTDLAAASTVARARIRDVLATAGFELRGEYAHSINYRHASGEPLQIAIDPFFDPMIERAERMLVGGVDVPILVVEDLIATKERAAADPARRRSKALRDAADAALLRGDVPDPDEGW